MPLIELIGYSPEQIQERVERYRPLFAGLPFEKDVVFVLGGGSRAVCLDGRELPFLRVRSRFRDRLEATRDLLLPHEDVECVLADFHPRRRD